MHSRFLVVVPLLGALVCGSGCNALGPIISALPEIIAVVTDATLILDQIEAFVRRFFAARPDPDKEQAVARALGRARAALVAAQRTAKGAQNLDQQKIDEAFADFKVAYRELRGLVDGIPGLRVARAGEPTLSATPGELVVPEPEALTFKLTK